MFSADYIHKSQEVSGRNLVNFKKRWLLREAYAIPYSVSPCKLSFGLYQSLYLKLHGFHAFFTDRGMAKVQIIMPVTLDGFLTGQKMRYWWNGSEQTGTASIIGKSGLHSTCIRITVCLTWWMQKRDETITVPFLWKYRTKKVPNMLVEYFSSDSQMNWSFTYFQYHIKVEKT